MRFAILSDLHANLEASEAVLADARASACTHFVCLGDVVGYNANPHECVKLIQDLDCPTVKGNHDEQASLLEPSQGFNELAEHAINWTRENLTEADKEWLRDLRLLRQVRDFTIVHATLDTPAQWGYVLNNLDAAASFTYQHTTVCFFGHTHFPVAYVRDGGVHRFRSDLLMIEPGKKYFINAGSVGQPRDGDWRAAYCIYDTEKNVVEQRRVKYDLDKAQKKILKAGLPRLLADRLGIGR
jgi:diadenosine tetraphosphatase ApaH/serine/threonine PP2A family protein phosphatase